MEIAQRAEVLAATAAARIGSHEEECARRYGEVAGRFTSIEGKIDRMLWGVASVLVLTVLNVVLKKLGYL